VDDAARAGDLTLRDFLDLFALVDERAGDDDDAAGDAGDAGDDDDGAGDEFCLDFDLDLGMME